MPCNPLNKKYLDKKCFLMILFMQFEHEKQNSGLLTCTTPELIWLPLVWVLISTSQTSVRGSCINW